MTSTHLVKILGCAAALATATACAPISSITIGSNGGHHPRAERPGPPPHAPAHGHRHKQRHGGGGDIDLVFDAGLGVYVVVGIPDRYYWDGYYLRLDGNTWYASVDLDGNDWRPRSARSVPPGLREKKAHPHARGGKHSGGHPAKGKGRW